MEFYLVAAIVATTSAPPPPPIYHGCDSNNSTSLPYCNTKLSFEVNLSSPARATDLISRLSIDEKVNTLAGHEAPHYCGALTAGVPRIGLPGWRWLTEANSNVAGCSTDPDTKEQRCSTVFVGPEGIAASFNRTAWWQKGDVISDQVRIHNNVGGYAATATVGSPTTTTTEAGQRKPGPGQGGGHTVALSAFGPNINTVKDPRYGRNSELPGECPFLAGTYADHYTQGMQQVSEKTGFYKMLSYLKHYTAYNKEADRFSWKANVTDFDMYDSYLPQYEIAFTGKGKPAGAMCSYFAANGVPSCGSTFLMNEMVRTKWNRSDAVFMSDCSAVANFMKNGYATNSTDASAKALNGGLDVYGGWGDHLWEQGYLHQAITDGQTTEAVLNQAMMRTTIQKMKVGAFDPLEVQLEWTSLGVKDLNTTAHQQVAYDAALQSLVLLKNGNAGRSGTETDHAPTAAPAATSAAEALPLPLARGKSLAVVGPLAFETDGLVSDYAKWHMNDASPASQMSEPPSIAEALACANVGGNTVAEIGVQVSDNSTSGIAAALAAVSKADAVVIVLGMTRTQEHEAMDRSDTLLPGIQEQFALQVNAAAAAENIPVVLVLCNGGILSIDSLVAGSSAIIEAFNPVDHGTKAVAESIFGGANKWGKLPVTIYNANYTAELDAADAGIADYSFDKGPGRGYRYFKGKPLYPFGHGLSYTTFQLSGLKNTGTVVGDEVVLVYHAVSDAIRANIGDKHPVPFKDLVEFERYTLQPGASTVVTFALDREKLLGITTADGSKHTYAG
eukprot:gene12589-23156_t